MKARRLAVIACGAAILGLGLVWLAGSLVARPVTRAMAAPPPPAQLVRLTASDGVAIEGSYWPGTTEDGPALLLLHGINNDRAMFHEQAVWLHSLGYAVLAIDLRGHGGSGAVARSFGLHEARDAEAGLAFLKAGKPDRKVGVIGVSLGGAAALLGDGGPLAAEALVLHAVYPDIRKAIRNRLERSGSSALAALSEPLLSFQSYGRYGVLPDRIAPIDGLRRYSGEVLVIGGSEDDATRVEDSKALYEAAPGPKTLWLVAGADHVGVSSLWNHAYRARVQCLFARRLGEPQGHRGPGQPFRS